MTEVKLPETPIFPTSGYQIAEDKAVVDRPNQIVQFHLQGQHDQQSHAGGRASSAAIPRGWSTPAGIKSDRPVEVSRTEVPAGDRTFRVTAANGTVIEARMFSASERGRERLSSEEWQQRTVDVLNGTTDGYDAAPTEVPPNVIVVDELPFGLPSDAQFAIAMVPVSQNRAGQQHEALPFSADQVHGNTIIINGSVTGSQSWEAMEDRKDIMMSPVHDVGMARYTGVHEYGHTRAGFEDDIPLLTEMYDELRPQSLSNVSTEWKSLSRYGKVNPAEAHAETFADWVLTGGASLNAATQFYSDTLEWYRLDGSLAAAAGKARRMDQRWLWCFDGPNGGVLITKASEETFNIMMTASPYDLLNRFRGGADLSEAEAQVVLEWIQTQILDGTESPEEALVKVILLPRDGTGQFHLQGQHDQQSHAGGSPAGENKTSRAADYLGYRSGEDVTRSKARKIADWFRNEFTPTGEFDSGDFILAFLTFPARIFSPTEEKLLLAADVQVFHLQGQHDQSSHAGGRGSTDVEFAPITADEARGNSRAVSSEEFQRLAAIGQQQIDELAADTQPIGLDENWEGIQEQAFDAAQESWGGATIEARTGEFLASDADRYALTVKEPGMETVTVPEGASAEEFKTAMTEARDKFRPVLERRDHYLGVFHDDDLNRIDFDPVTVVDSLDKVETIGAATRAIGGAYNFADGNGYWPPHVDDDAVVASASMGAMQEKTNFKGPAEWKRQAKQLEGAPDAVETPKPAQEPKSRAFRFQNGN